MISKKSVAQLTLFTFLAVGFYLLLSHLLGGLGFPLDDGWIHHTYARNFVRSGRWEYMPGTVSTGSTAPAWTLWLAIGYLLHIPPLFWSYLSGAVALFALAIGSIKLTAELWPNSSISTRIAPILIFSWPLIWAAMSGMETILFSALGIWILYLYAQLNFDEPIPPKKAALLGLLAGLLLLTRPDGVVLLFLIGLALLWHRQWNGLLWMGLIGAIIILPYFYFNYSVTGAIWPNTFYAKQTEYSILLQTPLWQRFPHLLYFSLGGIPDGIRGMSGAHLLLFPGLLMISYQIGKKAIPNRQFPYLIPLLWAVGHIFLYAWRLPVTYQHGRYLMPIIPIWIIFGTAGWIDLLKWDRWSTLPLGNLFNGHLWPKTIKLIFVVIMGIFFLLGAQAYATDVSVIEGEMVTTALWIRENIPTDEPIAAHDIGAIGYFSERPLIDLAGLITPEIIPLLDDPDAICTYIINNKIRYLVTAPGWPYTCLTQSDSATLLFSSQFPLTKEQGLNNMELYQLKIGN